MLEKVYKNWSDRVRYCNIPLDIRIGIIVLHKKKKRKRNKFGKISSFKISHHIRGVIKHKMLFLNFVSYVCSIFALFFSIMLVRKSVIYVNNIGHSGSSVCVLIDKKFSRLVVFW